MIREALPLEKCRNSHFFFPHVKCNCVSAAALSVADQRINVQSSPIKRIRREEEENIPSITLTAELMHQ